MKGQMNRQTSPIYRSELPEQFGQTYLLSYFQCLKIDSFNHLAVSQMRPTTDHSLGQGLPEDYKVLTTPDDRTLLRYSRKPSSFISWSVNINVIPLPCWPAVRYRNFRSSSRFETLYDLKWQPEVSDRINVWFDLDMQARYVIG